VFAFIDSDIRFTLLIFEADSFLKVF